jgi:hypothetical protein
MKRRHLVALSATAAFWATIWAYWYLAEASTIRVVRRLMHISDEDRPRPPGTFEGVKKYGPLTVSEIEAKWAVIDDQHLEPGVSFGYLNAQWQIFRTRVERLQDRHRTDSRLFEYRIPRPEWRLEARLKTTKDEVIWPESIAYCIERKGKVVHTFWASGALDADF